MDERGDEAEELRQVAEAAEAVCVIENAPLPLVVVFADGRIALANRAFCDLLGYAPGEVAGLRVSDVVGDEVDYERRWDMVLRSQGVTPDRVSELRRRDGSRIGAHVASLVVKDDAGEIRYVVARALPAERPPA